MPPHDKDGIIEQMFTLYGDPQYIVTFEEKPWLRLAVKPENICKYVSVRTLEDWEWKQTQLRTKLEEGELDPKVKARLDKQRWKERKASEKETSSRGDEEDVKRGEGEPSRPTKNKKSSAKLTANRKLSSSGMGAGIAMSMMSAPSPGGPGRRKREAEEAVYISPKRPTLSTPSKQQRGLAEAFTSESEDEEEDSAALERQLNGSLVPSPSKSKIRKQNSQSPTNSTSSPLSVRTRSPEKRVARSSRSSSMTSTELAKQDSHDSKRRRTSNLEDSVASISSRTAFRQYEELESKAKNKEANHFKDRYSTVTKQRKTPDKIIPPKFSSSDPNCRKTAPAIPSRLRESHSSSRDQFPAPLRRSSRSSSRASSRGPDSASEPKSGRPARAASASINYSISPTIHLPPKTQPQPEEEDDDNEYDVEAILDEEWRTVKGKEVKYYKIRWEGEWEDTWEPEQNVGVEIIKRWRMHAQAERKHKMKLDVVELDSGSE
jgi:hypothetical protein